MKIKILKNTNKESWYKNLIGFIGIEKQLKYFNLANKRLNEILL